MVNLGLLLAAFVAMSKAATSVYQKRSVLDTDEFITAWSSRAFALLVAVPAVLVAGIPRLSTEFFLYLFISGTANAIATLLIARAFKLSEVSLIVPMFAISPALMLITSPLIVGEFPPLLGILGVLILTTGTFFLKTTDSRHPLAPLKALAYERGVQLIFLVVIIYSITANVDKLGVVEASAIFWSASLLTVSSLLMFPVMVAKRPDWKQTIRINWQPLVILGVFGGAGSLMQMVALEHTLVVYVISIKRLSIPLSVVLGYFIFKEENLKGRVTGAILMVIGGILITLT